MSLEAFVCLLGVSSWKAEEPVALSADSELLDTNFRDESNSVTAVGDDDGDDGDDHKGPNQNEEPDEEDAAFRCTKSLFLPSTPAKIQYASGIRK